jgi:hypothetical protein
MGIQPVTSAGTRANSFSERTWRCITRLNWSGSTGLNVAEKTCKRLKLGQIRYAMADPFSR